MVASGTATLESSYFLLPFVLIYKVSWFTYVPGRLLIRVDHLGMPNILAGKEIVPEFIQHEAVPERIAETVWTLYRDPARKAEMVGEMNRSSMPFANLSAVIPAKAGTHNHRCS